MWKKFQIHSEYRDRNERESQKRERKKIPKNTVKGEKSMRNKNPKA